jgi:hypothetical protein
MGLQVRYTEPPRIKSGDADAPKGEFRVFGPAGHMEFRLQPFMDETLKGEFRGISITLIFSLNFEP